MGVKFNIDGLNKLSRKLDELSEKQSVPMKDILTDGFISSHSSFNSLDEFMTNCGIHTAEEFKAFPDDEMDKFVQSHTNFSSWKEMLGSAGAEYYKKQLGL